jgi:hemin uptake protein HemP
MTRPSRQSPVPDPGPALQKSVPRIRSEDLLQCMREVEIDHQGRIYRLRLTQLNKLILTA